jgi:glycerol-1-phosphatase
VNYTHGFRLGSYDAVVFDLDGTLWLSGEPLPGAAAFVERCRRSGAAVVAATNISITRADAVQRRLAAEGLLLDGEPVMTAGLALATALRSAGIRRVAVLGGEGLHHEIAGQGVAVHDIATIDRDEWKRCRPNTAVALGGWPDARLGDIETAGMLAAAGLPLYVTSLEAGFPNAGGFQAGAGMMIAAAKALHRFEPIVCGKPSAGYAAAVRALLPGCERLLVVGDSRLADVGLAREMGADSVLLVGARGFVAGDGPMPTFVARDLQGDITPANM